jgi:hypothetical protein
MTESDEEPKKRSKSPFKDKAELKTEITTFINIYKTTIVNHVDRMSDYFEMSCYNYIVKFYQITNYNVSICNLQNGAYRYKCSPSGIQSNFSHFKIEKTVDEVNHEFEIHHNLAVESAHNQNIYTTPDISVIKINSVKYRNDIYETKIKLSFVEQANLISFFEVKQFNPFPELLFNFIGVINELAPQIINKTTLELKSKHLAPSLMISGAANKQTKAIKKSLEERYCINIIYEMFYTATLTFSKKRINELRWVGKGMIVDPEQDEFDKYLDILIAPKQQDDYLL